VDVHVAVEREVISERSMRRAIERFDRYARTIVQWRAG